MCSVALRSTSAARAPARRSSSMKCSERSGRSIPICRSPIPRPSASSTPNPWRAPRSRWSCSALPEPWRCCSASSASTASSRTRCRSARARSASAWRSGRSVPALTALFVRQGLQLTAIGVACGLVVAFITMRLMSSHPVQRQPGGSRHLRGHHRRSHCYGLSRLLSALAARCHGRSRERFASRVALRQTTGGAVLSSLRHTAVSVSRRTLKRLPHS